jgi:hypothetical protein
LLLATNYFQCISIREHGQLLHSHRLANEE